ncbi:MAG: hypothetical protein ACRCYR_20820 [Phycicoccus sp.]
MSRIVWIELRRSTALFVVLGVAVTGTVVTYVLDDRRYWFGSWMMMAGSQRLNLILFAGLAAGAGAWHAGRDRGVVTDLLAATPRPRPQRLLPALGVLGVAAMVAYLAAFAVAVAAVASVPGYINLPVITAVTMVGGLAMLVAAWLGFTVGQLIRSRLTAPLVTVALLAVLVAGQVLDYRFDSDGSPLVLLQPALGPPLSATSATSAVPGAVSALQAVWLAALAAAAVLGVCVTRRSRRLLAILPVVAGAAVVVPLLPASSGDDAIGYVSDPEAAAPVCAQGTPRVCVTRVNLAVLPDITRPARAALSRLACLPDAPTTASEPTPGRTYPGTITGGTLWMNVAGARVVLNEGAPLTAAPARDLEAAVIEELMFGLASPCPRPTATTTGSRG